MSEKAVGYTTIGGDMEGALSVIANVPEDGRELPARLPRSRRRSCRASSLTLKKPASAELADDQEDEKDLMPFPVLDACFALYAGEKMSPTEVRDVLRACSPSTTRRRSTRGPPASRASSRSRSTSGCRRPLCLHVGNLDLDRERALQLPVVQRTEWG